MRFIPAGAGNTCKYWSNHTGVPVYPRWRGEHRLKRRAGRWLGGLSPLARGTHPLIIERAISYRFIPAGAGNTLIAL